jgi:thiamine-phosphate pyrophosphorylase
LLRCSITHRLAFPSEAAFLANLERQFAAGLDYLQLREKDLSPRDLLRLAQRILALPGCPPLLVNTRLDVALAAHAQGVHLPAGSLPVAPIKRAFPHLICGVSCHSRDELLAAQQQGADFAFLSPVFAPRSKPDDRTPLGLARFAQEVEGLTMPVFALGGITEANAPQCVAAGAAGIAAISLFQRL